MGDTDTVVWWRTSRHVSHRDHRWPPAHKSNKKGRGDTVRAGQRKDVDSRAPRHEAGARQDSFCGLSLELFGRQKGGHGMAQSRMWPVSQRGSDPNQIIPTHWHRRVGSVEIVKDRSNSPTDPASGYRVSHSAWDSERNLCVLGAVEPGNKPDRSLSRSHAFCPKTGEVVLAGQATNHADKRARPFRRRERRTARPPRVLIRERKPCFFARLRTLGWYGLFIVNPPKHRGQELASRTDGSEMGNR